MHCMESIYRSVVLSLSILSTLQYQHLYLNESPEHVTELLKYAPIGIPNSVLMIPDDIEQTIIRILWSNRILIESIVIFGDVYCESDPVDTSTIADTVRERLISNSTSLLSRACPEDTAIVMEQRCSCYRWTARSDSE